MGWARGPLLKNPGLTRDLSGRPEPEADSALAAVALRFSSESLGLAKLLVHMSEFDCASSSFESA